LSSAGVIVISRHLLSPSQATAVNPVSHPSLTERAGPTAASSRQARREGAVPARSRHGREPEPGWCLEGWRRRSCRSSQRPPMVEGFGCRDDTRLSGGSCHVGLLADRSPVLEWAVGGHGCTWAASLSSVLRACWGGRPSSGGGMVSRTQVFQPRPQEVGGRESVWARAVSWGLSSGWGGGAWVAGR
jgi:hypothetical protein